MSQTSIFKELPFYNTYIEKSKIKRLKNIDSLSELHMQYKCNTMQ